MAPRSPSRAAVSSTAFPINNDEDVYLHRLDTSDTATVDDTPNTTTLTLDDVTVDEADNGMATWPSGLFSANELVVTLSNGATITFESSYVAGATVSSTAFPINNDEDVYLDSSSFVVSVSGTNGGGNFESLDTSDTATVTVDDTPNTTTLTLDDVTVDTAWPRSMAVSANASWLSPSAMAPRSPSRAVMLRVRRSAPPRSRSTRRRVSRQQFFCGQCFWYQWGRQLRKPGHQHRHRG